MSSPYHYPKYSSYTTALCGQWSLFTELKISKVSVTCKKCLKKLDTQMIPAPTHTYEENND